MGYKIWNYCLPSRSHCVPVHTLVLLTTNQLLFFQVISHCQQFLAPTRICYSEYSVILLSVINRSVICYDASILSFSLDNFITLASWNPKAHSYAHYLSETLNSTAPPTFCHLHLRKRKTLLESKSQPILWYLHRAWPMWKEKTKNMIGPIPHSWTRTPGGLIFPGIAAQLLSPFTLPSLFHIFYSHLNPSTLLLTLLSAGIFASNFTEKTKAIKRHQTPLLIASVPVTPTALSLLQVKTSMIQCKSHPSTWPTALHSHLPKDIASRILPLLLL